MLCDAGHMTTRVHHRSMLDQREPSASGSADASNAPSAASAGSQIERRQLMLLPSIKWCAHVNPAPHPSLCLPHILQCPATAHRTQSLQGSFSRHFV